MARHIIEKYIVAGGTP
uniref:Uncharacterized protein n=1 Tax=Arundo donax TaxID=35708 RepID=A0A0A9FCA4_ARUDO